MLRLGDRVLAILLALGGVGHTLGSFAAYSQKPETLLWSLCATVLAFLLAALNLLRTVRPNDRALAWITVAGMIFYLASVVAFGALIGNYFDPRVIGFSIVCSGLILLGIRTATR